MVSKNISSDPPSQSQPPEFKNRLQRISLSILFEGRVWSVQPTSATKQQMEGRTAADLYGEALQHSNNGSDDWCDEDGSSREWESERIRNQFVTVGYRVGLMAGQEASAQDGFYIGFKQSVSAGCNLGIVRGVTSAINCLPDELKKRLV
ncbi:Essential protein Yae1 [Abeliophyllum distichum]|uniref:Essential protein Yae1 n=1 Tax=Abeliophyllum distichum TaxID=126358 RepID=A0ABD1QK01_9LAMI